MSAVRQIDPSSACKELNGAFENFTKFGVALANNTLLPRYQFSGEQLDKLDRHLSQFFSEIDNAKSLLHGVQSSLSRVTISSIPQSSSVQTELSTLHQRILNTFNEFSRNYDYSIKDFRVLLDFFKENFSKDSNENYHSTIRRLKEGLNYVEDNCEIKIPTNYVDRFHSRISFNPRNLFDDLQEKMVTLEQQLKQNDSNTIACIRSMENHYTKHVKLHEDMNNYIETNYEFIKGKVEQLSKISDTAAIESQAQTIKRLEKKAEKRKEISKEIFSKLTAKAAENEKLKQKIVSLKFQFDKKITGQMNFLEKFFILKLDRVTENFEQIRHKINTLKSLKPRRSTIGLDKHSSKSINAISFEDDAKEKHAFTIESLHEKIKHMENYIYGLEQEAKLNHEKLLKYTNIEEENENLYNMVESLQKRLDVMISEDQNQIQCHPVNPESSKIEFSPIKKSGSYKSHNDEPQDGNTMIDMKIQIDQYREEQSRLLGIINTLINPSNNVRDINSQSANINHQLQNLSSFKSSQIVQNSGFRTNFISNLQNSQYSNDNKPNVKSELVQNQDVDLLRVENGLKGDNENEKNAEEQLQESQTMPRQTYTFANNSLYKSLEPNQRFDPMEMLIVNGNKIVKGSQFRKITSLGLEQSSNFTENYNNNSNQELMEHLNLMKSQEYEHDKEKLINALKQSSEPNLSLNAPRSLHKSYGESALVKARKSHPDIKNIENNLTEVNEKIDALTKENRKLKKKITNLKSEASEFNVCKKRLDEIARDVDAKVQMKSDLEFQIMSLNKELTILAATKKDWEDKAKQRHANRERSESPSKHKNEIQKLQDKLRETTQELFSLKDQLNKEKDELLQKRNQFDFLKKEYEKCHDLLDRAQAQETCISQKAEELSQTIVTKDKENSRLTAELERTQNQIQSFEAKLALLSSQQQQKDNLLQSLEQELLSNQNQIVNLLEELTQSKQEAGILSERLELLAQELASTCDILQSVEEENAELKSEIGQQKEIIDEYNSQQKEFKRVEKQLGEVDRFLKDKISENENLKETLNQTENSLNQLEMQYKAVMLRYEETHLLLEQQNKKLYSIENENQNLHNESRGSLEKLQEELEVTKISNANLDKQVQTLTLENEQYKEKMQRLNIKLVKAKATIQGKIDIVSKFMSFLVTHTNASKLKLPDIEQKIKRISQTSYLFLEQSEMKESQLKSIVQDISYKDQQVNGLETELHGLHSKINQLQEAVSVKEKANIDLISQHNEAVQQFVKQIEELNASLKKKEHIITDHSQSMQTKEHKLEELERELIQVKSTSKKLEEDLREELQKKDNTVAHLEGVNKQLSKMIQEKEEELDHFQKSSMDMTQSLLKTNSEKFEELERKLKNATKTIELMNLEKTKLENELGITTESQKKKEIAFAEEKLDLQKAIDTEKEKAKQIESQKNQHITKMEQEYSQEKQKLSDRISLKEREVEIFKDESAKKLEKLQFEFNEISGKSKHNENTLANTTQALNEANKQLNEKVLRITELEKNLTEERAKAENLNHKLNELLYSTSQKEQQIEEIKKERIEALTNELISLKDKIRSLETEVASKEQKIDMLSGDLAQAKHDENSLKEQLERKNTKINELETKIETLADNSKQISETMHAEKEALDQVQSKELLQLLETKQRLESEIKAVKESEQKLQLEVQKLEQALKETKEFLSLTKEKETQLTQESQVLSKEFKTKQEQLEKELSLKTERILILETQAQTLNNINEKLMTTQQQAANSQTQITSSEQNLSAPSKCEQCQTLTDKLSKREAKAQKLQSELQSKISSLSNVVTHYRTKLSGYSTKFNKSYISILEQSNKMDNPFTMQLRASERKINSLKSKFNTIRLLYHKQRQARALAENQLIDSQARCDELKQTIDKQEMLKDEQMNSGKQNASELLKLNTELAEYKQKILFFETTIRDRESMIAQVKNEKNLLSTENSRQLGTLQAKIKELTEANIRLSKDVEVLTSKMKKGDIKLELKNLKNENLTLRSNLENLQDQFQSLEMDKEAIVMNFKTYKAQTANMVQNKESIEDAFRKKEDDYKNQIKDFEEITSKLLEIQSVVQDIVQVEMKLTNLKIIETKLRKFQDSEKVLLDLQNFLSQELKIHLDRDMVIKRIKEIVREWIAQRNAAALQDSHDNFNNQNTQPTNGKIVVKIDNDKLSEELKRLEDKLREYEKEKKGMKEEIEQLRFEKKEMSEIRKTAPQKKGFTMDDDVGLKENLKRLLFVFFGNLVKKTKNTQIFDDIVQLLAFTDDEKKEFLKMLETAYISDKIKSSLNLKV